MLDRRHTVHLHEYICSINDNHSHMILYLDTLFLNWNQRGAQSTTQRMGDHRLHKSTYTEQALTIPSIDIAGYLHIDTTQAEKEASILVLSVEGGHDPTYNAKGTIL